MGKRFWSLVLAGALIAGAFTALPAHAQTEAGATGGVVPATPNIVDPGGDANGHSAVTGVGGGLVMTGADILAVWFTNDSENLYTHVQVSTNARAESLTFITYVGPAAGTDCMQLRMTTEGEGVDPFSSISLSGDCGAGVTPYGPLLEEVGPDDTTILTGTYPLADVTKVATSGLLAEPDSLVGVNLRDATPRAGIIDDTEVGTDYVIGSDGGAVAAPPTAEPPGKADPPGKGKKKGCKKGKGKKKGACPGKKKPKPPAAPSCPAYVPGEEGAEAETAIVTDAATEEAPVVIELTAPAGGGNDLGIPGIAGQPSVYDETASLFHNIQVDTAAADVGLYVRYEFADHHDYDLYLNRPDGSTAANSGDFNVAPGEGLGGGSPDGGWEAGTNYEQVMGVRTADCGGYTARLVSYLTTGGATTLKIWLGDATVDPVPAEGGETAADMFFTAMRMPNPLADSAQASGTPAANKGCKKGKGKKKGCKKPPVACAPYTPGEMGASAETLAVTDAHTAEAPLLVPITLDADFDEGLQGRTSSIFNVQVDSASSSAGLYVTFEFDTRRDYDLYAYWPDGSEAASSHGFNPLAEAQAPEPVPFDPSNTRTNHAGETTASSENLVGVITPDCGGYTIEAANFFGEGGDFEVKVWLGEGTTEPLAPGA